MQKFKDALREEQKRLKEIIAKAKKENEHMPEGNLRISKHKNRCRYYHCVHDRNGIYIPKRNMILREQLAQKAYNSSIINLSLIHIYRSSSPWWNQYVGWKRKMSGNSVWCNVLYDY